MKLLDPPRLDTRRAAEFAAELRARARAWLPSWGLADGEGDFGRALLEIAARIDAEVAQRLDRVGDKLRRGFLDWLAIRGEAALPARVPLVFALASAAREAVAAPARTRMQVAAQGASVVFETDAEVRLVPGQLGALVAVDADADAFYLPAPGLSDLKPLEPLPTEWELKSYAPAGAIHLQLEPDSGLAPEMILEVAGRQHRVTQLDGGIAAIEPALEQELSPGTSARKVTSFAPFDGVARNRQAHALYLGHMDALNIDSEATLEIAGAQALGTGVAWQYWGKVAGSDAVGWQPLTLADSARQKPDALVLIKKAGSIDPYTIRGTSNRWIRAFAPTVGPAQSFPQLGSLAIRLNCASGFPACPPEVSSGASSSPATASPVAEGMANTTPLVLESPFFPLGKEPRQFDAFYLGCQEAFSKKGATAQLCLQMADAACSAYTAVLEGANANQVLAGVGRDGYLHLLRIDSSTGAVSPMRDPLQPPLLDEQKRPVPGRTVSLDRRPAWRLPVWATGSLPSLPAAVVKAGFLVAATAGEAVWAWREQPVVDTSSIALSGNRVSQLLRSQSTGWVYLGTVPSTGEKASAVMGLAYLGATADQREALVALRAGHSQIAVGRLAYSGPADWGVASLEEKVHPADPASSETQPVPMHAIVPVFEPAGARFTTSWTRGLVGVSEADGAREANLYDVDLLGAPVRGLCTKRETGVDPSVQPVVVQLTQETRLIAFVKPATTSGQRPHIQMVVKDGIIRDDGDVLEPDEKVLGLDVLLFSGNVHFIASIQGPDGFAFASWPAPAAGDTALQVFRSGMSASAATPAGAPTAIAGHVVIPGARGNALVATFDPSLRPSRQALIKPGVVIPASATKLGLNDMVARLVGTTLETRKVADSGIERGGRVLYLINDWFPAHGTLQRDAVDVYPKEAARHGARKSDTELALEPGDQGVAEGTWLWIEDQLYQVASVKKGPDETTPWVVTLTKSFDPGVGDKPLYIEPQAGRSVPTMQLNPDDEGRWDAQLLDRVELLFPDLEPRLQQAEAFLTDNAGHPKVVVLAKEFASVPVGAQKFVVDASLGEWSATLTDASSNPELSWEYWNGKGWWRLHLLADETANLKTTGALQLTVPNDIAPSDWAGKTNHWIRARLTGGDYGREAVTVISTPDGSGGTRQTVQRSSGDIHAPFVLALQLSYVDCSGATPDVVLAEDSGSSRDQTDANRTPGAVVEAFVSLGMTLGRLSKSGDAAAAAADPCPPACTCPDAAAGTGAGVPSSMAVQRAPEATPASGRALLIGLDAAVSDGPINILLLVAEERDHATLAPLRIEALVADRFVPIVASDTTRALGESGLLSLTFAVPPTRHELFGRSLVWLRLTPAAGTDAAGWRPTLRGAYLNAAWASAAETLTRELLGSSDGAPGLTFQLARPPVLRGTLELRVREPLSDEERAALRAGDPTAVLSDVDGLPGDWVRWTQVVDPGDELAGARVYALDEATGEIRFGDGLHGAIPPIGRDAIVAFSYRRTEPGTTLDAVPANTVAPRTALGLVSPIESVESVVAADQADGGTPAEAGDRVLRFGTARVRHRGRAVTAADLEDLAMESSPDVLQARCILRPGHARLVVVVRGPDPRPGAAQLRELRRLLAAAAPAALRARALRIEAPGLRRLRIALTLSVASLDRTGELGRAVRERLGALFDTRAAGASGWPLGRSPEEADLLLALADVPDLESLGAVELREVAADGAELPWPQDLAEGELALLAEDGFRIQFQTVGATA